ncbi:MAG: hypothetical protein JWO19_178 [Bryobacterales bacterium]|nr:hypothetical protein [Bryobacterales bacterium]
MQHAMQALAGVLPDTRHLTLARETHMVKPQILPPELGEFFSA